MQTTSSSSSALEMSADLYAGDTDLYLTYDGRRDVRVSNLVRVTRSKLSS